MVAGSLTPQASNNCTSCLRAASSFQARFLATSVNSSSSAPSRSPLAFSASARSKRACAILRIGCEFGAQRLDGVRRRRLARKLQRGARACHGCGFGLCRRDEPQRLLGAGEIAGLDVALGESGKALRVLAILLQDLAEQLRRGVDVAGGKRRLGGFEVRRNVAGRVADQTRDKGVDAGFGQRSHEAVDRTPVLEGEHGGDGLHAHLPGDLRMIVDIELDQPDRALCRAHRLFQDRRELAAGTAPRRPEIDQHRHLARGLDHVAHEVLGGGVLNQVGLGAAPPSEGFSPAPRTIGVSHAPMLLGSPCPARWAGASRLATGRKPLSAERKDAGVMAASWMKRMRSCVASRVVAVFTRGWQLTSAKSISAASTTTVTSAAARIDQRQRRNRTGCNTEHGLEQFAFGEAEPPGVEPLGQRLEIDPRVVLGDDEHLVAVLVGEEQGLGMRAGDFRRKEADCSTVNTGGCSTVVVGIPSSCSRAKSALRSGPWR